MSFTKMTNIQSMYKIDPIIKEEYEEYLFVFAQTVTKQPMFFVLHKALNNHFLFLLNNQLFNLDQNWILCK